MIKKYYHSLVSMKYVYFMFSLPLMIFIVAFIEQRKKAEWMRYVMIVLAILLAIVMFFYYKDKLKVSKQLKNIANLSEYEKGGVVDRTWVLEDRMLCCKDFVIHEVNTKDINNVTLLPSEKGKTILKLSTNNTDVEMSALDIQEAQRLVAFLKRKNPNLKMENIEAKGNGTLEELGAGVN